MHTYIYNLRLYLWRICWTVYICFIDNVYYVCVYEQILGLVTQSLSWFKMHDNELMWADWSHLSYVDVIKWKHFPRYWPFVQGIHRSPVNSPHKGQWRGALMFSLICAWLNSWVNNREAGDSRRHSAHYDVSVMNTKGNHNEDTRHDGTGKPVQSNTGNWIINIFQWWQ